MAANVLEGSQPPSELWGYPLGAAGEEGSWLPYVRAVPSPPAWQVLSILAGLLWLLACRASRVVPRVRQWVQPVVKHHVAAGAITILAVQKLRHPVLDAAFSAGAWVVSIEFYTAFLPLFFWTGNVRLGCNLTILMALCIWVGNSIKDIVCAPRPPSPPVRRLTATDSEREGSLEFGLPSSHTINTICLSLYVMADVEEKGLTASWPPLHAHALSAAVLIFVAAIVFGRLYLGMHSAIDVAAGAVLGALVPLLWRLVEGPVYDFVLHNQNLEAFMVALAALLLLAYPLPEGATPSYEHHTAFTGVVFGVVVGIHRVQHLYYFPGAPTLSPASPRELLAIAKRCAVGFVLVLLAKAAAKAAAVRILPPMYAAAGIPFHSTAYLRTKRLAGKLSPVAEKGPARAEQPPPLVLKDVALAGPPAIGAESGMPIDGSEWDIFRSPPGPLLTVRQRTGIRSEGGGTAQLDAQVPVSAREVGASDVLPPGIAAIGAGSHGGRAPFLVHRHSRAEPQLPAGGNLHRAPQPLSNKVADEYVEHTVEKGLMQQCCYWLLNVASVDIDTGIRFAAYAGLAWAVVEPAPHLFRLLNI